MFTFHLFWCLLLNNKINSLIDVKKKLNSLRRSKPSHKSFNSDAKSTVVHSNQLRIWLTFLRFSFFLLFDIISYFAFSFFTFTFLHFTIKGSLIKELAPLSTIPINGNPNNQKLIYKTIKEIQWASWKFRTLHLQQCMWHFTLMRIKI
jgi:hypothetical protein